MADRLSVPPPRFTSAYLTPWRRHGWPASGVLSGEQGAARGAIVFFFPTFWAAEKLSENLFVGKCVYLRLKTSHLLK